MNYFLRAFVLFIFLLWIFHIPIVTADQNYYIVTAYYSPLPGQEYYSMWSYQAEVTLNWEWIAGASGREVFSGMLAAPQWYSFWTKIYLEWLWIGSVEDRGWAIVPAGQRGYNYDRIDVWMGYWDEGLRRALYWWKRTIPGHITKRESGTSINYYDIPAPAWTVNGFKKQTYGLEPENKKSSLWIFELSLEFWDTGHQVHKLQSILTELWYIASEDESWKYDQKTFDAVFSLQLDNKILVSEEDPGAGRYWPKTRSALKKAYDKYLGELIQAQLLQENFNKLTRSSEKKASLYVESIQKPIFWDISPEVRELQKSLALLWYFHQADTAIFWVKTKKAITAYQLDRKIIDSEASIWTWIFWPKTRESLKKDLAKIYFEEMLISEWLNEEYISSLKK